MFNNETVLMIPYYTALEQNTLRFYTSQWKSDRLRFGGFAWVFLERRHLKVFHLFRYKNISRQSNYLALSVELIESEIFRRVSVFCGGFEL